MKEIELKNHDTNIEVSGSDISCFEINKAGGIGCGKHHAIWRTLYLNR